MNAPILPNERVSKHDRDDFIRNLLTILLIDPAAYACGAYAMGGDGSRVDLSPPTTGEPVVTLEQIKLHCHIEPDQTDEDSELILLESAARIHTENVLRRRGELGPNAPENVKTAMLVLIAHWYRNREAVISGVLLQTAPLAYDALLSPEREYSEFY